MEEGLQQCCSLHITAAELGCCAMCRKLLFVGNYFGPFNPLHSRLVHITFSPLLIALMRSADPFSTLLLPHLQHPCRLRRATCTVPSAGATRRASGMSPRRQGWTSGAKCSSTTSEAGVKMSREVDGGGKAKAKALCNIRGRGAQALEVRQGVQDARSERRRVRWRCRRCAMDT